VEERKVVLAEVDHEMIEYVLVMARKKEQQAIQTIKRKGKNLFLQILLVRVLARATFAFDMAKDVLKNGSLRPHFLSSQGWCQG
jgi:aminoglycoside phosphotransferase family enzyme